MKRRAQLVVVLWLASACASAPVAAPETITPLSTPLTYTELSPDLFVDGVTEGVVRFMSWKDHYDKPVVANGLLVLAPRGVIAIDAPHSAEQARLLADWSRRRHHREIRQVILTQDDAERDEGARALAEAGATLHALPQTRARAVARRATIAIQPLAPEATLDLWDEPVELFFPGPAHTPDNLAVWLPKPRVLFGGTVVVATGQATLGKLELADPAGWRVAINRLIERYPDVQVVVPAQGDPGGRALLLHTRELVVKKALEPPR